MFDSFFDIKNLEKFQVIISLLVTTIIICILAFIIFYFVRKQKVDQTPNWLIIFLEGVVNFIDNLYDEATEMKLKIGKSYIFSLFSFLLVGNLVSLLGLQPIVLDYQIPLFLAFITWLIIVVLRFYSLGIIGFFLNILNPLNFIGLMAILISLSFRIFGNILGGSQISEMVFNYSLKANNYIFGFGENNKINILSLIFMPWMQFYFDIFSTFIQAYIFILLTSLFWGSEMPEPLLDEKNIYKWSILKGVKEVKLIEK